jgi:hypothetical protein
MSTIINADTSDGLKFTSDTSGEIKLQSGGTDIATVDSSGITMASGKSVADSTGTIYPLTSGTAVTATGSETSFDFTGIPSWVKKITVSFFNINTSTANDLIVQLGTSGGFVTSGYLGGIMSVTTGDAVSRNVATSGMMLSNTATSGNYRGASTLTLLDSGIWTYQTGSHKTSNSTIDSGGGGVDISGTLTQLRFTTDNGTYTFNSGAKINILYE